MTDQTLVKPEQDGSAARCAVCKSTEHTTGYHENTPTGYHENGVPVEESEEK